MNTLSEMGLVNDYTVTWCIYLLASIGIFMVVWRLSRSWPTLLRQALRFVVACVILVPVTVVPGSDSLAPAFIVAVFEVAAGNTEGAVTALSALALAVFFALLIYGLWLGCKYFYKKTRVRKAAAVERREAAPAEAPAA